MKHFYMFKTARIFEVISDKFKMVWICISENYAQKSLSLSLAPQLSLALGLLHNLLQIQSGWISWGLLNNFIFYRVGLLAPRPTPTLEDQASVLFISPRGRVAQLYPQAPGTHFSRLLRHAWVTVGLFLFPGHHTGNAQKQITKWLIINSLFCQPYHIE
jgi:hypothetical protein